MWPRLQGPSARCHVRSTVTTGESPPRPFRRRRFTRRLGRLVVVNRRETSLDRSDLGPPVPNVRGRRRRVRHGSCPRPVPSTGQSRQVGAPGRGLVARRDGRREGPTGRDGLQGDRKGRLPRRDGRRGDLPCQHPPRARFHHRSDRSLTTVISASIVSVNCLSFPPGTPGYRRRQLHCCSYTPRGAPNGLEAAPGALLPSAQLIPLGPLSRRRQQRRPSTRSTMALTECEIARGAAVCGPGSLRLVGVVIVVFMSGCSRATVRSRAA